MSDIDENNVPQNLEVVTSFFRLKTSYTLSQKKDALEKLAMNSENKFPLSDTANELGIDSKLLSKWNKSQEKIMNADCSLTMMRIGHTGRPLKRKVQEDDVVSWTLEKRALSLPVSVDNMTSYVLRKYPNDFSSFLQCRSWIYQVLERRNLSIRRKTHDQNTSLSEAQMGEIHLDFVFHVRRLVEFPLSPYETRYQYGRNRFHI